MRLLHLHEQFLVLAAQSFHSVLKPLDLLCSVPIVSQDIFLFDFKRASSLLSTPFFVNKLSILRLEEVVRVGAFPELLVHEPVLPRQRLDVLGELCHLLSLELRQLRLLVDLLLHAVALLAERLDFLLAIEELPLVSVFLAGGDTHLVLHVAEIQTLLLVQLLHIHELLRLLVQVTLHLV